MGFSCLEIIITNLWNSMFHSKKQYRLEPFIHNGFQTLYNITDTILNNSWHAFDFCWFLVVSLEENIKFKTWCLHMFTIPTLLIQTTQDIKKSVLATMQKYSAISIHECNHVSMRV